MAAPLKRGSGRRFESHPATALTPPLQPYICSDRAERLNVPEQTDRIEIVDRSERLGRTERGDRIDPPHPSFSSNLTTAEQPHRQFLPISTSAHRSPTLHFSGSSHPHPFSNAFPSVSSQSSATSSSSNNSLLCPVPAKPIPTRPVRSINAPDMSSCPVLHPTFSNPSSTDSNPQSPSFNMSSIESIDPTKVDSIYDLLQPHGVPIDQLDERYHAILMLVRSLIGITPNGFSVLEIFPPAFSTYNLIIPNFINVPFLLWGVAAPVDLISLALYYSSRSAQCSYCSVHTCSFAVRRGVDEAALTGERPFTPREAAVVDLALNMSSFPNHTTREDRRRIYDYLSPANVEWVVLSIAMVGMLTTYMSSLGVDLEETPVIQLEDMLRRAGWSEGKHHVSPPVHRLQNPEKRPRKGDSILSNLMMLRYIPAAILYDKTATMRIPKSWPAIGDYLTYNVGHSFPILGLLTHGRAVRALAEVIRMNLDAIVCGIEPDVKYLIGIVFAGVNRNRLLSREFRKMTMLMVDYLDDNMVQAVHEFSREDTDFSLDIADALSESVILHLPLTDSQVRMLYVAKACSFTPTKTSKTVVEATKALRREHTVELTCWVAVLSLLHKLYIFYYPGCTERAAVSDAQLGERAPQLTKMLPRID